MARLARFGLPTAFLVRFDYLVRIFLKCIEYVFVTALTGRRSDVLGRLVVGSRGLSRGALLILGAPRHGYTDDRCHRRQQQEPGRMAAGSKRDQADPPLKRYLPACTLST